MTTIVQSKTIAASPDNWASTLAFNQFNPAAGTLLDTLFTTTGTIAASASIENLAPVTAEVNLGVAGSIVSSAAGIGVLGSVEPVAAASVDLAAFQGVFNGTVNFSAPSAKTVTNLTASQTALTESFPVGASTGATPIAGNGTFNVNVTSTASSTVFGNGNLAVLLHTEAGASVSLRYDAAAPGDPGYNYYGAGVVDTWAPTIFGWPIFDTTWVTSTPRVVSFAAQTSGWSNNAGFAQFNPALGTLDQVLVTVNDSVSGTFSAENLDAAPASIGIAESGILTVTGPGELGGLSALSSSNTVFTLGAYDGTQDFGGISGQSASLAAPGTAPASDRLTDAASLAAFTGTGTVVVPVSSVGLSDMTGPGNLYAVSTQQISGSVTVQYVYTPATAVSTGPGVSHPLGPAGPGAVATNVVLSQLIGAVHSQPLGPPSLAFISASTGAIAARPNETFLIGAGGSAFIQGFSASAGDRLDLTALLAGAPLAADLSNIGEFVKVVSSAADASFGIDTKLTIAGLSGTASLILNGASPVTVLSLLQNKAVIFPAH